MRRFLNQLNPSSLSYHTSKKVTISLFLMLTSCSESDFSGKAAQGKKPSSSNIESKDPPAETPISTPTDAPTKKLDSDGNDLERYPELNAPFSTSDGSKVIIEGKEYIATNAIAVVFEDSPSRGHTAWNSRDIKVCVKGQFAFDATSRIIRSISKKGIEIDVEAYRKPASSLRHKFLLEIHDQGQKIREEGFDTETNNNFNRSKIQLKYGEELVLAFDLNPLIAGVDRDNHKRAIDNPKPAPLISVNSCTPPKW